MHLAGVGAGGVEGSAGPPGLEQEPEGPGGPALGSALGAGEAVSEGLKQEVAAG